jgi:hypothetical protein
LLRIGNSNRSMQNVYGFHLKRIAYVWYMVVHMYRQKSFQLFYLCTYIIYASHHRSETVENLIPPFVENVLRWILCTTNCYYYVCRVMYFIMFSPARSGFRMLVIKCAEKRITQVLNNKDVI